LLDHLERHDKFIQFMKNNEFLDMDSNRTMVANIEKVIRHDLRSGAHSFKSHIDCEIAIAISAFIFLNIAAFIVS
jgi:hypothetical protein